MKVVYTVHLEKGSESSHQLFVIQYIQYLSILLYTHSLSEQSKPFLRHTLYLRDFISVKNYFRSVAKFLVVLKLKLNKTTLKYLCLARFQQPTFKFILCIIFFSANLNLDGIYVGPLSQVGY